ncbi:glutathione S-transferase family protein [Phreatobacter aquaticus]|uniref:Glutathione S-transferase family protein n=1 Tax=Phreatobacter aquaticus TaxID=2570229 RepID=A0A4D7QGZ4_9HYPH|nr:glutathione S-transferase family protein [Phreatobacter aquaticus]QCK85961.1 glutathione S-transferase family protein [Phreatobacter aquaticus]
MTELFAHPFSAYCQKVLVALYENDTPFTYRMLGPDDPGATETLHRLWPFKRFPLLVDDGKAIPEASIIIEHLDVTRPGGTRFLPDDPGEAQEVRLLDRVFDNDVMTQMQKPVFDALRPEADRDPFGVVQALAHLDIAYRWLDTRLEGRTWAAGERFSLADCAAAPSLFYADWVHPIDPGFSNLRAYRARLLARPSFARAVDEARPFRSYFPLGAPDRD